MRRHQRRKRPVGFDQRIVRPRLDNHPLLNHKHLVKLGQVLHLVGHHHHHRTVQRTHHVLFKQVPPHMRINRRERVIQQVNIPPRVQRTRQRHPRLLPATQVDPPLPNLGQIARREDLQVGAQRSCLNNRIVRLLVKREPKQHVVLQRRVRHPRLLRHVRHRPVHSDRRLVRRILPVVRIRRNIRQNGCQERRLACPHRSHNGHLLRPRER